MRASDKNLQQLGQQRIQSQSLHTLDSMQVRVRGLGSHARHATPRAARAAPRRWRWPYFARSSQPHCTIHWDTAIIMSA